MPYIKSEERVPYTKPLDDLLSKLALQHEHNLGGHLNYCISYLMTRLWEENTHYVRANTIRGAMNNALDEWYRFHVVPYEEKKRHENGDV